MFAPPRRPKAGETEQDLLREQQQFQQQSGNNQDREDIKQNEVKDEEDSLIKSVLKGGRIVERNASMGTAAKAPLLDNADGTAFPQVFQVSEDQDDNESGKKGKSLFARMARKNKETTGAGVATRADELKNPCQVLPRRVDFGSASAIVDGSGLEGGQKFAKDIHEENAARIAAMSEEDILESRRQLMSSMDPSVLEFIRSKRIAKTPVQSEEAMEVADQDVAVAVAAKKPRLQGLHMDRTEPEKMEWTKDVPAPPKEALKSGYAARFDFDGRLMPFGYGDGGQCDPPDSGSGLYHHGEEPDRPGYSVEELLTLARSTNAQQKALALNSLAAVVKNYKSGSLDECLQQNLLSELLQNDLLILLRTSLDDTSETLREATLLCLRQVLDSQFDEACLDTAYFAEMGHLQPSLPTSIVADPEERAEFKKDEAGLKDVEVIKVDCIKGLMRTDLLQRFSYLLSQPSLSSAAVSNIACILIRMCRHSMELTKEVMNHSSLTDALKIMEAERDPKTTSAPLLKLTRVISSWNASLAGRCLAKFGLRDRISKLVSSGFGVLGSSLEALRTWDCLLRYGMLTDLFLDLFPLLLNFFLGLRLQLDPTGQQQHTVHLELAGGVLKVVQAAANLVGQENLEVVILPRHLADFKRLLMEICPLLIGGITEMQEEISKRRLRLLGLALETVTCLEKAGVGREEGGETRIAQILQQLSKSVVLKSAADAMSQKSSLLSGLSDGRFCRDTKNLPSFGAVCSGGLLVPTAANLEHPSPFRLLSASLMIWELVDQTSMASWLRSSCRPYLEKVVERREELCLKTSWFSCDEIIFLARATLAVTSEDVPGLAGVTLSLLQTHHTAFARPTIQRVFQEAFSKNLLAMQLEQLQLDEKSLPAFSKGDDGLVSDLYVKALSLPPPEVSLAIPGSLTERNSGEALLPSDWMFLPLLRLYDKQQRGKGTSTNKAQELSETSLCLYWVASCLSATTKLSPREASVYLARLATTFLLEDCAFLEETVRPWLSLCVSALVRACRGRFDLEAPVLGVGHFKTYYATILEEYFASSYGDPLFATLVLLPTLTANRGREALVQHLWRDCAENLFSVRLSPSDLPAPLSVVDFVAKESEDVADALVRAIAVGRVNAAKNPLLFQIAAGSISKSVAQNRKVVEKHRQILIEKGVVLNYET